MKPFILLFFVFTCQYISGQTFGGVKKFDTSNGFISDLTYGVYEDAEGYNWITTENGIAKYNGNSFKRFTIADGLPSNDVIYIDVDKNNRKWLSGYYKGLYYIENNIVKRVKGTSNLNALKYSFERNDTLYFSNLNFSKTFYFTNKGELKELPKIFTTNNLEIKIIGYHNKEQFYIGYCLSNLGHKFYILNKDKKIICNVPNGLSYYPNLIDDAITFVKVKFYTGNNNLNEKIANELFIFKNNTWIQKKVLNKDNIEYVKVFSKNTRSNCKIFYDEKGSCTIVKNNNIDKNLTSKINALGIDFNNVYSITLDDDQNIWYLNYNGLLTYVPNNYDVYKNYSVSKFANGESFYIKKGLFFNKKYYFLTTSNVFYEFDIFTNKLTIIKQYGNEKPYNIFVNKDSIIIACTMGCFDFFKIKNNKLINSHKTTTKFHKASILYSDNFYYLGGVSVHSLDKIIFSGKHEDFRFSVFAIDDNQNLLIANEEKIYKHNLITKKESYVLLKNTTAITPVNNIILVGTNSGGLMLLDYNLKLISKVLEDNSIIKIIVDSIKNIVYVATNDGLSVLKLEKNSLKLVRTISSNDGLINGKINSLNFDNNNLYISTANGFSVVKKEKLYDKIIGEIEVENVLNENTKLNFIEKIFLKPSQNNISIITAVKSYNDPKNFNKYYNLSRENEIVSWIQFKDKTISFKELQPGNYKLQLYVSSKDSSVKSAIKTIYFYIEPLFWQTLWFKVLLIIFLVALIFVFMWLYKSNLANKYRIKLEMSTMELKLLKTQMNPHFIFNILNNIQSSMILGGIESFNKNMVSFSKVLRRTLDMVNNEVISLADEVEYIKAYIDLQNLRLSVPIKLNLIIDSNVNLHTETIPVMVLQPIIENAVIHGLWNSKGEKNITLKIDNLNDYNLITIEDNGVGRNLNKEELKNKHKSYATLVLNKRLSLFSEFYKKKYELNIIDLFDKQGKPCGTKVELTIPKTHNHLLK